MKIFFDTEFTGLYKRANLISIGLVDENGRSFYAENIEWKWYDYAIDKPYIDKWIVDNVFKNLLFIKIDNLKYKNDELIKFDEDYISIYKNPINNKTYNGAGTIEKIREVLLEWLSIYDTVEWVSDVSHYDFVLLIDLLYENALNMPYGKINASCHDINQDIAKFYNINEIEAFNKNREDILSEHSIIVEGIKHNSMYDAKVIKELYKILNQ